jgi:hypothetical protein
MDVTFGVVGPVVLEPDRFALAECRTLSHEP